MTHVDFNPAAPFAINMQCKAFSQVMWGYLLCLTWLGCSQQYVSKVKLAKSKANDAEMQQNHNPLDAFAANVFSNNCPWQPTVITSTQPSIEASVTWLQRRDLSLAP